MKNFFCLYLLVGIFSFRTLAQTDVSHVRLSIITCGPGDELYSLFGHTALRVTDSVRHSDVVYNWGTFSFNEPNFYGKFLRGKLLYYVSVDHFQDFLSEYVYEHRNVYEQALDIDKATKQKIMNAVDHNMQGDNRFYKYDFLLDNCTTRVKNIVFENDSGAAVIQDVVSKQTTSRDLIHYYLERGGKPWTELGIDMLLGSRLDRIVSNDEAMFLPEFFMKGLSSAQNLSAPVTEDDRLILPGAPQQNPSNKFAPLVVMAIACLLLFIISQLRANWARTLTKIFDALLLYITGLLGVLLMFMWFGTDHTVCQHNFNLAWALPTNLVAAFCLIRRPSWLNSYFFIAAVITGLLLAAWFWLPQQLNIALLPVTLLLLNRYVTMATRRQTS